jgi:hypothetical protein
MVKSMSHSFDTVRALFRWASSCLLYWENRRIPEKEFSPHIVRDATDNGRSRIRLLKVNGVSPRPSVKDTANSLNA